MPLFGDLIYEARKIGEENRKKDRELIAQDLQKYFGLCPSSILSKRITLLLTSKNIK
jgi:hypothetical protein